MSKETLKKLEEFELVVPARELYNAIIFQTQALKIDKEMNAQRMKELNLAVKSLNSYIRAFGTKVAYFRVLITPEKIGFFKKLGKKFR